MFDLSFAEILLLLVFAHALADYPLQGQFLAEAKNHKAPLDGVPWYQALVAHAAIHGGFVGLITGSLWLGVAEFAAHAIIDHAKCSKKISYNLDQALHVACKCFWVVLLWQGFV